MPRKPKKIRRDPLSVFLNVPFDPEYEPIFLALIVGLVTLGLKPRSVIEIPDGGQGRMERLFGLIRTCGASVHDLSRVTGPLPRFNMPFELGIAYALRQIDGHSFYVFEEERYRLDKTLSDLRMIDPKIHEGKGLIALRCVYECFKPAGRKPPVDIGTKIYESLDSSLDSLRQGSATVFNRISFESVIAEAVGMNLVLSKS